LAGDELRDRGELGVEKRDLSQTRVDGLTLLDRQLKVSQPPPAADSEQVGERRLGNQPALQRRLDLVL
jgi:hypothetical protein